MQLKITESERKIIQMYCNGLSMRNIENKLHLSHGIVSRILKKNGVQKHQIVKTRKIDVLEHSNICKLYINGQYQTEIAKLYNVSNTTISNILKENGIKIRDYNTPNKKYLINETYFDEICTPEKAYILGLLYADGTNINYRNTIKIELQEKDKDILDRILKEIGSDSPLIFYNRSKNNSLHQNTFAINICNKHISQTLEYLGMIPNKSLKLTFPSYLHQDLYSHFIRGYCDGDGSFNKYCFGIVGTESFCNAIGKILEENIDITYTIYNRKDNLTPTREIRINQKEQVIKVLNYIYKDSNIHLTRKYEKYLSICL